jgi:hypothetical protein
MKAEEKLNEIENLLADLNNNVSLLQEKLLNTYDNYVSEDQYENDKYIIKYLSDICEFIGKRND